MGASLLDGPLDPAGFAPINAVFLFKKAPNPDGGRLGVKGHAYAAPSEITRMLYSSLSIDRDEAVAENL